MSRDSQEVPGIPRKSQEVPGIILVFYDFVFEISLSKKGKIQVKKTKGLGNGNT